MVPTKLELDHGSTIWEFCVGMEKTTGHVFAVDWKQGREARSGPTGRGGITLAQTAQERRRACSCPRKLHRAVSYSDTLARGTEMPANRLHRRETGRLRAEATL